MDVVGSEESDELFLRASVNYVSGNCVRRLTSSVGILAALSIIRSHHSSWWGRPLLVGEFVRLGIAGNSESSAEAWSEHYSWKSRVIGSRFGTYHGDLSSHPNQQLEHNTIL